MTMKTALAKGNKQVGEKPAEYYVNIINFAALLAGKLIKRPDFLSNKSVR